MWVKSTTEVKLRARRARDLRRNCRSTEGGGERPLEESAPRKRVPHRFLTSGNAHAEPPSWWPLQSARRKIGAADDDTQPAARSVAACDAPQAGPPRRCCEDDPQRKARIKARATFQAGGQYRQSPSRSSTDASGCALMPDH